MALVCNKVSWSNACTSFLWQWTRPLFGRSSADCEMLESFFEYASVDCGNTDKWKWLMNDNGCSRLAKETARNKLVPRKIELFAWRSLRKRIPARVEFYKKGIDLNSVRYPMCDDGLETVEHVLIFCKYAMDIWVQVFNWWGLGNVTTLSIEDIFRDSSPLHGSGNINRFGKPSSG
ncbi:uncharacterized protein [Rutidosis leptorrhynchoides]|uniref:uncharacterized protein n=1 Tax=Rutidosis leptorrhynchoides TaxID=125765 RepID=UPI003A98D3C8